MDYLMMFDEYIIAEEGAFLDTLSNWKEIFAKAIIALWRKFMEFLRNIRNGIVSKISHRKHQINKDRSLIVKSQQHGIPPEIDPQSGQVSNILELERKEKELELEMIAVHDETSDKYFSAIIDVIEVLNQMVAEMQYGVTMANRYVDSVIKPNSDTSTTSDHATASIARSDALYETFQARNSAALAIVLVYNDRYPEGYSITNIEACDMINDSIKQLERSVKTSIDALLRKIDILPDKADTDTVQTVHTIGAAFRHYIENISQIAANLHRLV